MKTALAENQLTERETPPATFSVKKILVALDLSPHSEATAQYALGIAKTLGASLVLVHVFEPIPMNEFTTYEGFRVLDHDRQVMEQALTDLTGTLRETSRSWFTSTRRKFNDDEITERCS